MAGVNLEIKPISYKAWVNQFNTLAQLIEWLDRIDRLDWPRELPEPLLFKKTI